ncbi:plasmid stabilization protein [Marinobacter lutaoensis]|jgi:toxin ParE1/3/4|uniref:Toxin n=1 Tax=Marinobacter lutaoensis TaxID=135739 RepID=A0A1V2DRY7_9GAMM|nr:MULTISPECIES: type II toxin-antitoxin system RelE/ParE family toxin [Gammaproteobacteria]ONF43279.1 plasmid stabilization protein [Marinobacter lutaoensis]
MMAYTLVISPVARDDLKQIYQYGALNWGISRATSYLEHIKEQLWHLTEHPEMGVMRDELLPAMRSLSVDSHVVFYRLQELQVQIVRVLHARQDPQLHIK